jgi:hypothetical protein
MNADTFRRLVVYNDGEPIEHIDTLPSPTERLPTWIVRSRKDLDRDAIRASLKQVLSFGNYVLAFPDAQTMVAAPDDLLPRVLKRQMPQGNLGVELKTLVADNDVAISADLKTLKPFRDRFAGNLPMAGVVQGIDVLNLSIDISGKGPYLHNIHAVMQTESAASQLSALMTGLIQMQKAQIRSVANTPNSPIPAGAAIALAELYDHVEVIVEGKTVYYRMSKPQDVDSFLEQLKPAFARLFNAPKARPPVTPRNRNRNRGKHIGLAFHIYHDAYNAFPRYNVGQ